MRFELKSLARVLCAVVLSVSAAAGSSSSFAQKKPWKQKKEKHFEPAERLNVRECAGRYVGIDDNYWIDLRVDDRGRIGAVVHEDGREAQLADARLDGATLRATKVYASGKRVPFVATFGDRVRDGVHAFGFTDETANIELPGITLTRVFYRRVAE